MYYISILRRIVHYNKLFTWKGHATYERYPVGALPVRPAAKSEFVVLFYTIFVGVSIWFSLRPFGKWNW